MLANMKRPTPKYLLTPRAIRALDIFGKYLIEKMRNKKRRAYNLATHLRIVLQNFGMLCYLAMCGCVTILNITRR
jgi:hypothetical protein